MEDKEREKAINSMIEGVVLPKYMNTDFIALKASEITCEQLHDDNYRKRGDVISGHDVAIGWKDTGNYKLEEYLDDTYIITRKG